MQPITMQAGDLAAAFKAMPAGQVVTVKISGKAVKVTGAEVGDGVLSLSVAKAKKKAKK